MHHRNFAARTALLALLGFFAYGITASAQTPPNIVLIVADHLGTAISARTGNPTIRTPHLDRLAFEGQKWTTFYVAESVCTPSRAALLTGRLPIRNGMNAANNLRRVFFPDSTGGLPAGDHARGAAQGARLRDGVRRQMASRPRPRVAPDRPRL